MDLEKSILDTLIDKSQHLDIMINKRNPSEQTNHQPLASGHRGPQK